MSERVLGRNARRSFQRAINRKNNPIRLQNLGPGDLFALITPNRNAAYSFEQFVNERLDGKLSNMFGRSFNELLDYSGMGEHSRNSIAAVYEICRRIISERNS